MQYFTKKERGFTLIELLVVIAVIGLLSSIVLVSLGGTRSKARDARRKSDMRQIVTAMEMYNGDNEAYPVSATMPTAIGTYLPSVPKDPKTNGVYGWISNAAAAEGVLEQNQKFCVYATLENGTFFYTASHGGNVTKTAAPTTLDNCATP